VQQATSLGDAPPEAPTQESTIWDDPKLGKIAEEFSDGPDWTCDDFLPYASAATNRFLQT
jgi:hypothetical protein